MKEENIILDWMERNYLKLPLVSYSKEVYDFICATSTAYIIGSFYVYKVNDLWQRIIYK